MSLPQFWSRIPDDEEQAPRRSSANPPLTTNDRTAFFVSMSEEKLTKGGAPSQLRPVPRVSRWRLTARVVVVSLTRHRSHRGLRGFPFHVGRRAKYSAQMHLFPHSRPILTLSVFWKFSLVIAFASSSCARPHPTPATAVAAIKPAQPPALPPPLSLVPSDVARTGLVATFVIPALDRSLASGVDLVKRAAPLPLDAAGVRDMLLGQAGLPADVAKHLDLGAPIAGAAVVAGPGRPPLIAFSFAGRTAADVMPLLRALGRTVGKRGSAIQIENTSGDRGWFLPQGNVVLFADTDEALVRAGNLAFEARQGAKDDASVIVYPEMLARAAGTDVKTALGRMVGEIEERAATGGNKLGPEGLRQIREMAEYLGGVASAEFALVLDAASGASFVARLRPKAGSSLETVAQQTKTVPIDARLLAAALLGKDDAGFAMTSAYGAATLDQLRRQRAKLPSGGGKPLVAAGRLLDAVIEGLTGEFSMVGRGQPGLSGELIYAARDAAAGTRIQEALLASNKESIASIIRAATQGEGLEMKVQKAQPERLGKIRVLHATFAVALPGDAKPALRKLLGPAGLDVFIAVVGGDRVAVTMGQGAKARMTAIASGQETKPGQPQGAKQTKKADQKGAVPTVLTDAIAASGGRSLFTYFDLRQVISLAQSFGGDARLRMLAGAMRAPMPILGGAKGDAAGSILTLDLTVPPTCFVGIGALVQAAMMTRN